jgi:hypothetical protein
VVGADSSTSPAYATWVRCPRTAPGRATFAQPRLSLTREKSGCVGELVGMEGRGDAEPAIVAPVRVGS